VSEAMAKRFWPGENPRARAGTGLFSSPQLREGGGVIADVKTGWPDADERLSHLYALTRFPPALGVIGVTLGLRRVVHTTSRPAELAAAVSKGGC